MQDYIEAVVVFVVDVIVGVVVVLQSARWEKSQTDDLKGKSLILKHSKKKLEPAVKLKPSQGAGDLIGDAQWTLHQTCA